MAKKTKKRLPVFSKVNPYRSFKKLSMTPQSGGGVSDDLSKLREAENAAMRKKMMAEAKAWDIVITRRMALGQMGGESEKYMRESYNAMMWVRYKTSWFESSWSLEASRLLLEVKGVVNSSAESLTDLMRAANRELEVVAREYAEAVWARRNAEWEAREAEAAVAAKQREELLALPMRAAAAARGALESAMKSDDLGKLREAEDAAKMKRIMAEATLADATTRRDEARPPPAEKSGYWWRPWRSAAAAAAMSEAEERAAMQAAMAAMERQRVEMIRKAEAEEAAAEAERIRTVVEQRIREQAQREELMELPMRTAAAARGAVDSAMAGMGAAAVAAREAVDSALESRRVAAAAEAQRQRDAAAAADADADRLLEAMQQRDARRQLPMGIPVVHEEIPMGIPVAHGEIPMGIPLVHGVAEDSASDNDEYFDAEVDAENSDPYRSPRLYPQLSTHGGAKAGGAMHPYRLNYWQRNLLGRHKKTFYKKSKNLHSKSRRIKKIFYKNLATRRVNSRRSKKTNKQRKY